MVSFNAMREFASASLWLHLPAERDDQWLETLVDTPRLGWDWVALKRGFFSPLRTWALLHDARLRPVFAGLLIDVLGGDSRQHGDILAALELHYLSAIMLDNLRNGHDLASSTAAEIAVPLPVWVTVAYNSRQLSVVMIARLAQSLNPDARMRLTHSFARFLFQQAIGSVLDLVGSERELPHTSMDDFVDYLSLCTGTRSFGLAALVASAACGLSREKENLLTLAANEFGVALRLRELSRGETEQFTVEGCPVREQPIRWHQGICQADLKGIAERQMQLALHHAGQLGPAINAFFLEFAGKLGTSVSMGASHE